MDIKEYKAGNNFMKEVHHPWEYARFNILFRIFKKFKKLSASKVIVDIGCGDIFFIKNFSLKFPDAEYYGIDTAFDDKLINEYKSQPGSEKINLLKSIQAFAKQNESADIIFLMDVIEHIEDDKSFLKNLSNSSFFHSDTLLFTTVPAYQGLFVSRDTWLGHYRRYNLRILEDTMTNNGFEVIKSHYLFFSLLIPRIITKMKEKFTKQDLENIKGIGGWHERKIIDAIIIQILRLDFLIISLFLALKIKLPGLSCFVLCKKQP